MWEREGRGLRWREEAALYSMYNTIEFLLADWASTCGDGCEVVAHCYEGKKKESYRDLIRTN
jgi:hypothetical protein